MSVLELLIKVKKRNTGTTVTFNADSIIAIVEIYI